MKEEDIRELVKARKRPVTNMKELSKRLIGTRDGFIYYTSNFRLDFDNKMAMLGQLEFNWKELKKWLEEEININSNDISYYDYERILQNVLNKIQELENKDE